MDGNLSPFQLSKAVRDNFELDVSDPGTETMLSDATRAELGSAAAMLCQVFHQAAVVSVATTLMRQRMLEDPTSQKAIPDVT